jgi:hypothetical protein
MPRLVSFLGAAGTTGIAIGRTGIGLALLAAYGIVRAKVVACRSNDSPGSSPGLFVGHVDVGYWHKADMPSCTAHVRFRG